MSECGDKAHRATGESFLKEDIEALVNDLDRAKREDPFEGIKKSKKQKIETSELTKLIEKRNRLLNAAAEIRLMKAAKAADDQYGNPALGLHAKITGVNSPMEGNLKSVHAVQLGLVNKYIGGLIHDLRKSDLLVAFNNMSGEFELEVAKALSARNTGDSEFRALEVSKDAKGVAGILHKYQSAAIQRENRAGAYIRARKGYIVRQNHSPRLMIKKGKKAWSDFVRNRLDFEAMSVPKSERAAFLEEAYLAIKSGIRVTDDVDDVTKAFKGPSNLGKKESANRVLVFKTAEDWVDYDREFGYSSLREAFVQDLFRAARATSVMSEFGTNPGAMLEKVKGNLMRMHRGDDKKLRGLQGRTSGVTLQAAMDEVTGEVNMGASSTVAQVGSAARAIQTMAKLGGSWVAALSDVVFSASNSIFTGAGLGQAWGRALSGPLEGMSTGDKRAFGELMGAGLENQIGDFMSRMHAQDEVAGTTAKMLHYFFKLNLLGPWTSANKFGVTMAISRDLALNVETKFDDLPVDLKRILVNYNVTSNGWDLATKALTEGPDGKTYLLPRSLDDISIEDVRQLQTRNDQTSVFGTMTDREIQRFVEDTQESLLAMLSNEADHAVPSPGARERAILRQGYRPGTPEGEAIRFVAQFKSFGVTVLTRVIGRAIYGKGAGTLGKQMKMGLGANMGLVHTIVMTTFMGGMILQAKNLLAGREPEEVDGQFFMRSMLQGGALGLYGDFMLNEYHKYGGVLDSVVGPVPAEIARGMEILSKGRGILLEDEGTIGTDVVNFVKGNTPLQNLFYTKQATDYLIWYHFLEAANPGYLRRMERRLENDGVEFFAKPSENIERGGFGFQ